VILVEAISFGDYVNTATIVEISPFDIDPTNNVASVEIVVNERSNNDCGFLFNQFSPNSGDAINNFLFINCIQDYPNNSIEIYDRYGNQVFEARPYDNTWDGTRNNNDLPKGTYFYVLDLVGDGSEVRKGWIQIIRQ
jgi:gliding motility-associated-like protein